MISALSRLPRLNGNKLLLLLLLSAFISSCSLFRKAESDSKPEEIGEELDPLPGRKIYDPETGTLIVVEETPVESMDTIRWKLIPTDSIQPILSAAPLVDENAVGNPSELIRRGDYGTAFYTAYNVGVMLPFLSDRFNPESEEIFRNSAWALNFYGGMQMAFDELEEEGVKLNVQVIDTEASPQVLSGQLSKRTELFNAHLLIGAYRSDNVELLAEFARRNNITYVSPHSASSRITATNPNYLQVSPTLASHCQAITRHARDRFGRASLVLVARDKEAEKARFAYFQEENFRLEGRRADTLMLKEMVVKDDGVEGSSGFSDIALEPYLSEGDTTVFILPSWSNETFIYAFLSQAKLMMSTTGAHIVVYGMPQWQQYERIDFDLYEDLSVHISSDTYLDAYDTDVAFFRNRFFDRYGVLPGSEAYLGYDIAAYFGRMLQQYGTKFQYMLEKEPQQALHTRFDFERVVEATTTGVENPPIQRFENKHVNILRFEDYRFQAAYE